MRHMEETGAQGFYIRPGSGPSMERVVLREPDSGVVNRHALVPPALVQKHIIGMHLSDVTERPNWGPMYANVSMRNHVRVSRCMNVTCMSKVSIWTSPSWRSSKVLICLILCVLHQQAPTGGPVVVRGDNVPWHYGEHPILGRGHNSLGDHRCEVRMPSEVRAPVITNCSTSNA